jgi:hypothetical protein
VGIRETLNEKPALTTGITIGIIVLVLAIILFQMRRGGGSTSGGGAGVTGKSFFSTDDGATYFPEDSSKIPPFDYKGKTAVRAYVFSCDGKPFVAYLQRYTPEAKKQLEAGQARGPGTVVIGAETGAEVKAPRKGDWVKSSDPKGQALMRPQCSGTLDVVSP